jgi:hypothetical protein
MKLLAALLLAFSTATATAAAAPAPALPTEITAEYQLVSSGLTIGRVKETFVRKGETYSIQSVTRSEGLLKIFLDDQITLQSRGRVVPAGLQPLAFSQRRAKDAGRDVEATFDWERGVMRSLYKGEHSEVPLPRDTQDRISVMYQFMNITARDEVTIPMSNGRKVELYTYRLVGEARVSTPAGEFDTLHYQRVTSSPKESRAEVWLAKDRFNFPVRLVFDDPKGLRIEQALVALQSR